MKLKKLIAAVSLCCIALSGCGSRGEVLSENMGNSDGNITNLGSVCEKDDTLYYQNYEDNFAIYKSVNGGNGVKLNDGASYFINVLGDYVYYVSEDNDFHVFRMKTDGSENTEIIKQKAYYMTVYNDSIYYVDYDDDQSIYMAKTDGTNAKKIVDSVCYYPIIADNALFYVDYSNGGKVMRADLDGSSPKVLDDVNNITAAYLNYYDGKLYYANAVTNANADKKGKGYENYIMCYDLAAETTSTVVEKPCADVNVYDGRVYYSSLTDNKVYSSDLDGGDERLVYDKNGIFINVTSDNVYCYVKLADEEPYIAKIPIKSIK